MEQVFIFDQLYLCLKRNSTKTDIYFGRSQRKQDISYQFLTMEKALNWNRKQKYSPFFSPPEKEGWNWLTLSKNIIESHGGYLAYRNEEEKNHFL
jgi:hypothetical protein